MEVSLVFKSYWLSIACVVWEWIIWVNKLFVELIVSESFFGIDSLNDSAELIITLNVTLDHKTNLSQVSIFFEIEISASHESWINRLSIDVWFVRTIFGRDTTIWKSEIWRCKKI